VLEGAAPSDYDPSLFQIIARVKKAGDLDYVRDAVLSTIRSFQEKPVDAAKLETVKKHLRYRLSLSMDSSDSIASVVAAFVALRRTPETMNRLYDQYAQLTPADIQAVAARYLVEQGRTIVTLKGPDTPAATAAAGGSR
jgi:zinc protease